MKLLCVVIAFILAFVIGQIIVLRVYLFSFKRRLFDPVDDRKVHAGLIPRLGGMAFLPTQCSIFMLVVVVLRHFEIIQMDYALLFRFMLLICGLGLLFIVGVVDDLVNVSYKWKFAAQIVAALFFSISGLWIDNLYGLFGITFLSPWIGIPLTVLVVVFIVNAFNLIDGIDGLCSGLAIMACTILGTLFFIKESWLHVIFAFITVGVLAPFFYYNVYGNSKRQRRIFMGDTGSMTLGLSVSFLILNYTMSYSDIVQCFGGNIMVGFSVVIVPVLDVVRVILLRLIARKPLFLPDKNHIHHCFLALGFSPYATLCWILSIGVSFAVFNMFMFKQNVNINIVVLCDIVFWFGGLWLFKKIKRNRLQVKKQE